MTPLQHIRREVFSLTQAEMAAIAGVRQATWSRWECGHREPTRSHLNRIRAEATKRGLAWDDRWFFTVTTSPNRTAA